MDSDAMMLLLGCSAWALSPRLVAQLSHTTLSQGWPAQCVCVCVCLQSVQRVSCTLARCSVNLLAVHELCMPFVGMGSGMRVAEV